MSAPWRARATESFPLFASWIAYFLRLEMTMGLEIELGELDTAMLFICSFYVPFLEKLAQWSLYM
jgi:hypothetical protein